jgi:hypothetical protein
MVSLAAAVAGCGGGGTEPGVATAGTPTGPGSPTAGSNAVTEYVESKRRWVACLRGESYSLPDPDAKGNVDLSRVGITAKTDPKWVAAQRKCQEFLLPVPAELEESPVLSPQEIAWAREYAKCVRANGVSDFPDPGPDGHRPRPENPREPSPQEAAASLRAHDICAPVSQGGAPRPYDPNRQVQG